MLLELVQELKSEAAAPGFQDLQPVTMRSHAASIACCERAMLKPWPRLLAQRQPVMFAGNPMVRLPYGTGQRCGVYVSIR
jgi:hypothetical protein